MIGVSIHAWLGIGGGETRKGREFIDQVANQFHMIDDHFGAFIKNPFIDNFGIPALESLGPTR